MMYFVGLRAEMASAEKSAAHLKLGCREASPSPSAEKSNASRFVRIEGTPSCDVPGTQISLILP